MLTSQKGGKKTKQTQNPQSKIKIQIETDPDDS